MRRSADRSDAGAEKAPLVLLILTKARMWLQANRKGAVPKGTAPFFTPVRRRSAFTASPKRRSGFSPESETH